MLQPWKEVDESRPPVGLEWKPNEMIAEPSVNVGVFLLCVPSASCLVHHRFIYLTLTGLFPQCINIDGLLVK